MHRIALVTCRDFADLLEDERILVRELEALGIKADAVVWDDPEADWLSYDLVLIRTPWDYSLHHEEFLSWIDRLEAQQVNLLNPPHVLRWNMNKRYLVELRNKGVNLLNTMIVQPGDPWTLEHLLHSNMMPEAVVKPLISASARNTWRVSFDTAPEMQQQWLKQMEMGEQMVQEFAPEIQAEGEWSLIFFDGEFSHALVKTPKQGDFRVQEKHGGSYEVRTPTPKMIEQAQFILNQLDEIPLYARVDVICRFDQLFLMELELLEPQLFFALVPEGATRLAEKLSIRLGKDETRN